MKFSCPNCTAKYQIADEKVAGRTVKMKCRKCGSIIPIVAPSKRVLERAPEVHALSVKPSRPGGPPTVPASLPAAQWHAGIGGSARGPMTDQQLRKLVDEGSASKETFVWKEGMDGWKPLSEVAELAHILGGAAAGPPSMPAVAKVEPPKSRGLPPAPRLGQRPPPSRVALPKPSLPSTRPHAPTPTPSAPLIQDSEALSVVENERVPPSLASDEAEKGFFSGASAKPAVPKAAESKGASPKQPKAKGSSPAQSRPEGSKPAQEKPEGSSPAQSRPEGSKPAQEKPEGSRPAQSRPQQDKLTEAPVPDIATGPARHSDQVISVEGPYVANHTEPSYESIIMRLQKKRHNPYAIPIAVAGALIFGITLGFVFFGDQETKIIRQVVEVPAKVKEAAAHKKEIEDSAEKPAEAEAEAEEKPAQGTSRKVAAASPTPKPASEPTPTEISKGLKGLSGLQGLAGPDSGPSADTGSSSMAQPLEASQIQSTVSKYRTSVKRGCWQPALDARDKDAPSSARVTVKITVTGSGNVTAASTTGDPPGYRGLASCISSKVRSWQFPRSSGTTTVNVPFVFAAQ